MASRKPVVEVAGRLQEIPPGDDLIATIIGSFIATFTNNSGVLIPNGAPVYITAVPGEIALGTASGDATIEIIGLADEDIATTSSGTVVVLGVKTLADWTAVTATVTLTAGSRYFLSTVAGQLTLSPTFAAGEHIFEVGLAQDTTTMSFRPNHIVKKN